MVFPRNSLRAFLSHAKNSLSTSLRQKQRVTLVIGNEAADLDSLTSSLLYAYIRSQAPPTNAFTPLYIPVLNIPAIDVALRPEFTALFHQVNLEASHLITLDNLHSSSDSQSISLAPSNTQWILVDHNRLQGSLGDIYSSYVRGTIDHHDDENTVPQKTGPEPRIIAKCGSCTSLVVRYLRPSWDALSSTSLSSGGGYAQGDSSIDDSAVTRGWDAQVAKLALASILIDTRNLQDESKTLPVDEEAVAYLESKIKMSGRDARVWDRTAFFQEIDNAKRDLEGLSVHEILRKDYKEWREGDLKLGVSSVVKALEFLVHKAESEGGSSPENAFDRTVSAFMAERGLAVFGVMTTSATREGQFQRQLLLQTRQSGQNAATRFEEEYGAELQLQHLEDGIVGTLDISSGMDHWRRSWRQLNVGMSRKQVAPYLRKAMQAINR